MDYQTDFRQTFLEPAEPRGHVTELLPGRFVESGNARQGGVALLFQAGVKGLGGFNEGLVEGLRRELTFFQGFLASGFLLLRLRLILVSDSARILVLEEIVAVTAQGNALNRDNQPGAKPIERGRALFGVAIVQFGIEIVPELIQQALAQLHGLAEGADAFPLELSLREPDRQLQVLALGGDGILAELGDLDPVGHLALVLPGALG